MSAKSQVGIEDEPEQHQRRHPARIGLRHKHRRRRAARPADQRRASARRDAAAATQARTLTRSAAARRGVSQPVASRGVSPYPRRSTAYAAKPLLGERRSTDRRRPGTCRSKSGRLLQVRPCTSRIGAARRCRAPRPHRHGCPSDDTVNRSGGAACSARAPSGAAETAASPTAAPSRAAPDVRSWCARRDVLWDRFEVSIARTFEGSRGSEHLVEASNRRERVALLRRIVRPDGEQHLAASAGGRLELGRDVRDEKHMRRRLVPSADATARSSTAPASIRPPCRRMPAMSGVRSPWSVDANSRRCASSLPDE